MLEQKLKYNNGMMDMLIKVADTGILTTECIFKFPKSRNHISFLVFWHTGQSILMHIALHNFRRRV